MPVVKTPALTHSWKRLSPYTMTQYHSSRLDKSPQLKICAPHTDGDYYGLDFVPYNGEVGYMRPTSPVSSHVFTDLTVSSFSQWANTSPCSTEADIFDSGYHEPCPPASFSSQPLNRTSAVYDSDLFQLSYDENFYDPSFSFLAESNSIAFSPTTSSPRSDHSGLSLSPQPQFQEYTNAFNFDFATSLPHEFPSSSMFPSDHLRITPSPGPSSKSHSPTYSCSSLDPTDIKTSPSRDSSPLRNESDHQQHRRRFPCLIIGCERRFTSQYTLKVHMEAHKPKPRSSFPCTLGCAEKFSRQHDRLRHEVAKHGKVCEFSCDDCGRFFSTRKTLGNHKCPVAHGGTRWVNN